MTLVTDIHIPHTMTCDHFGDPLTSPLAALSGRNLIYCPIFWFISAKLMSDLSFYLVQPSTGFRQLWLYNQVLAVFVMLHDQDLSAQYAHQHQLNVIIAAKPDFTDACNFRPFGCVNHQMIM